jgi:hypothetical protein
MGIDFEPIWPVGVIVTVDSQNLSRWLQHERWLPLSAAFAELERGDEHSTANFDNGYVPCANAGLHRADQRDR